MKVFMKEIKKKRDYIKALADVVLAPYDERYLKILHHTKVFLISHGYQLMILHVNATGSDTALMVVVIVIFN